MIRAIGPYQLVRRLGRGGMAEVHLAIAHGASGFERHVAIKMLAPELAGEPELERALIREATLAGTLHHRNLVAVLGLGVDAGITYVVIYIPRVAYDHTPLHTLATQVIPHFTNQSG